MPLNNKVIGKKYPQYGPFEITDREGIFFALAYNEDNDAYFDKRRPGGTIISPMFAVRYMAGCVESVLIDKETGLNYETMFHHCQEFEWLAPVRAGDKITSYSEIVKIETGRHGGILDCAIESKNQRGDIVSKSIWSFLDKSAGSDEAALKRPMKTGSDVLISQDVKIRNGQTWIYAEASGDFNPIHIDEQAAKKSGLDGIILQGLCTMSFCHKVCVDNLCGKGKDPLKLKKLSVEFARPVTPGEIITFRLYKNENPLIFRITATNQKNKNILYNSWCLTA